MTEKPNTESPDAPADLQTKIPVFATVGHAYSFVFANIGQVLLCLVQLAVVSVLPTILISRIFPPLFSAILTTIWSAATVAPFAVLVHRAILLSEALDAKRYIPSFRDPRVTKFIMVGLMIYAVPLLLQLGSSLFVGKSLLISALLSLAYFVATIYVLRYMLAFPAIATDRFTDLSDAHSMLKGSIARVFFAMVVAFLPVFVLIFIFVQDSVSETGEIDPWIYFLGLILAPIFPAILSFAYKDRAEHRGGDPDAVHRGTE